MRKLLLGIATLTLMLTACDDTPDTTKAPTTDYVGDNSRVVEIVNYYDLPENNEYDSIEIQSDTEPYGLTVFVTGENLEKDAFSEHAEAMFDSIDNLGELTYTHSENDEEIHFTDTDFQ